MVRREQVSRFENVVGAPRKRRNGSSTRVDAEEKERGKRQQAEAQRQRQPQRCHSRQHAVGDQDDSDSRGTKTSGNEGFPLTLSFSKAPKKSVD
jgi:hypothetical protein